MGSALTKEETCVFKQQEEWKTLLETARQGDRSARDRLVMENTGLVYMVLKRFINRGHEPEDLFQIGVIGLLKAIDKFDVTRDFSFSTYAVPMIIGEIRRFLRDDGIIHVSRQIKDNARKVAVVKERLKKELNEEPGMEELMQATGLSAEEIVAAIEAGFEVESIYQPLGSTAEGSSLVLADQLEDHRVDEQELINRITVGQMLETLGERERRLIELRYLEGKTQTESAQLLGMNQVAVSRMEKKILLFLRTQF